MGSEGELAFSSWVLASLLLYLLGSQALRLNITVCVLTWLADHGAWEPIWWGVRLGYLIGLPYLALLAGAASPRGMGLIGLDWVHTLGLGVPLTLAAWGLILVGWHWANPVPSDSNPTHSRDVRTGDWLSAMLEAGAQQMHWAFYRDAWIRWWDPYWGAWISLLTVWLEGISGVWSWHLRSASLRMFLINALLALVTTALYLTVPNWWLGWGLHVLVLLSTRITIGPMPIPIRSQNTDD
jgi:hypothetical protein